MNYKQYLKENLNTSDTYSGIVIANYYKDIGSREGFDEILYNEILYNTYLLKKIKISDLLKTDINLNYFIKNEINDTDIDNYFSSKTMKQPIIIGDTQFDTNIVIDGYHRIVELLRNNKHYVNAYVPTLQL